jgi:hypothetical protein
LLDHLRLVNAKEDRVEDRDWPLDDFEPATRSWLLAGPPGAAPPAKSAVVADTGERKGEPELALHLPAAEHPRHLWRSLLHYALRDCGALSFKARADTPCRVEIALWVPENLGISSDAPATASMDIKPSPTRRNYSMPLGAFAPPERVRTFRTARSFMVIRVPEGVDFWLDNVAFVWEAKGPRLGRVALFYELGKLIHVGMPALAAFVVFVVILFALRVEEAREAWEWLREKGLKKVIGRFRRRKA